MIRITPHPVLKVPTRAQLEALGEEKAKALLAQREELIAKETDDPWRHGYYLPCWKDADALLSEPELLLLAILGGNGSGKSFYLARKGVEKMVREPGAKVLWLHESDKTSVIVQQAAVWRYLPAEIKERHPGARHTRVRYINYTIANGFSDGHFVLPNGSLGIFGSYKQNVGDYEGTGWSLVCADENLPLSWLRTLLVRLPRCNGRFIWGFTPIRGMTPAIAHVSEGAVTLKSRPAPELPLNRKNVTDCPKGEMPYIRRSLWPRMKIIHFFSEDNPYEDYHNLVSIISQRGETEIERRIYGYARNIAGKLLAKFSAVHVVDPDKIPQSKVTRRMYADPAGSRNMFMIWVATDEHGRRFVYREWPDVLHYGEWATTSEGSKWDGEPGPAQPGVGFGVMDYKRIILELEGNTWDGSTWNNEKAEEIYARFMDPRSGAAQSIVEKEGGNSLMDIFMQTQADHKGNEAGPMMVFYSASGAHEDEGIQLTNDLLSYNSSEEVVSLFNEPKLYISSQCQNTIWACQNYTGHDGKDAACKDPVDCLRYLATSGSDYIDNASTRPWGGGSY